MATLPAVKLEMLIGETWVDLAGTPARLDGAPPQSRLLWSDDSGGPVEVTRGVGDGGAVASGSLDCALENNDGALTPKRSSSPYHPYLVKGRRVRFSAYFGGSWRSLFAGFVASELLAWKSANAAACNVQLSAVDAIGMAYRPLRSVAVEATAARLPKAYWPLTDSDTQSAADQSGSSQPGLAVQHYGADGGEISWGSGVVLPTDNVGGLVLTPSGEKGYYLRSSAPIDLPVSWSLTVFPSPAAKDGYVVQVGTDSYSIGLWWDTSLKKFKAIETLLDSSGDPVDYVLATSDVAWTGGMEQLYVSSGGVMLGSSVTGGARHATDTMLASLVSVGGALAVESGRARLYSGEVKHLAIWAGGMPPSGVDTDTLTGPAAMTILSTAAAQVLAWSGYPVSVTTRGSDLPVQLVKLEGLSGADVLSQYAQGTMARIFCGGDGNLVVSAWDYAAPTVAAPAGDLDVDAQWGANASEEVAGATVTWPDGTTYTAGNGELAVPGVLARGREVADWQVASSDGSPRFPDAAFHLLTMSDAEAAALALVDVGSLLLTQGLPTQLPAASQSGIVDVVHLTLGASVWDVELSTSPDDHGQLLVVGDATRGVVGAGFKAAPLGPEVGGAGTGWKAGAPITADALNSSAYAGSQTQAGASSIITMPSTLASTTVTFPAAFASAPTVLVQAIEDEVGSALQGWGIASVTATGFTVWVYQTGPVSMLVSFGWTAVL